MQTLIIVLLVAAAVLYLGRQAWKATIGARRAERESAGCASGCGCTPASAAPKRAITR